MSAVNALNAGMAFNGFVPSSVSVSATCTKVVPSAIRVALVPQALGSVAGELRENGFDERLIFIRSIGLRFVPNHRESHA
ncbi:MAG: hypothetical protein JWO77_1652 [Ilumatobacteraceae bacterium]|nr:hypothetical protein [Ilumatobacteraceae bacterium]